MNLESNLVSISASTFSVVSNGRGNCETLITSMLLGIISTPLGAFADSCTVPVRVIIVSFLAARTSAIISSDNFLLGAVNCVIPFLSLINTNTIPPRSLISCTHPVTLTVSPASSGPISFE